MIASARKVVHMAFPFAATLLSGCSPPHIDIVVSNSGGRHHAEMSQDWGLVFSDAKPPCIREASLFQGNDEWERPAWKIVATGDVQCLPLASFTVGTAPVGFTQTIPMRTAAHGHYKLVVQGIGWGEAAVEL